jgi:hypothetical protein
MTSNNRHLILPSRIRAGGSASVAEAVPFIQSCFVGSRERSGWICGFFPVLTHTLLAPAQIPSRPGGPPAKRQPSPEGLGWNPHHDPERHRRGTHVVLNQSATWRNLVKDGQALGSAYVDPLQRKGPRSYQQRHGRRLTSDRRGSGRGDCEQDEECAEETAFHFDAFLVRDA